MTFCGGGARRARSPRMRFDDPAIARLREASMIVRVPLFPYVFPDAFWGLVAMPQYGVAYLLPLRGTWKGTLIEQTWFALGVIFSVLTALVPWRVRVDVDRGDGTPKQTISRVRWLGWLFLWGIKRPRSPNA